jgi:hypothetical protein
VRELYRSGSHDSADDRDSGRRPDSGYGPSDSGAWGGPSRPDYSVYDDDEEYSFNPESNAAIEARLDEAGLPTRAESRAAARRLDTADEDDEDDFGPESGDTTIEASRDPAERARAGAPAGRAADNGAAPEHGPVWLDRADRPSDLKVTRPYDQPSGLTRPEPRHEQDIDDAAPKRPDGRPERFPDPRGEWLQLVNDGGPEADPLRGNNCLDCSLSLISTWHGEPQVSAPRFPDRHADGTLDKESGERHGIERAQLWLGHPYEYLGSAVEGFHAIEKKLRAGGHGASAAIMNTWKDGFAHAWNAVNSRGEILWIDSQVGAVDKEPVHTPEQINRMWAIVIDKEGRAL